MNLNKLKQRIYIFLAIAVSFGITWYFAPRVFISGTPQINTAYIAELRNLPAQSIAYLRGIGQPSSEQRELEELERISVAEAPPDTTFTPIGKGVQASEPDEEGKRFYKIEAGTKLEVRTITLDDGQVVKIYIPIEE